MTPKKLWHMLVLILCVQVNFFFSNVGAFTGLNLYYYYFFFKKKIKSVSSHKIKMRNFIVDRIFLQRLNWILNTTRSEVSAPSFVVFNFLHQLSIKEWIKTQKYRNISTLHAFYTSTRLSSLRTFSRDKCVTDHHQYSPLLIYRQIGFKEHSL